MSKGDVVYVRGMQYSDSDDENVEDIWDDKKLNEAYDKAVKIAQAEVAKRIAMSTNTQTEDKESDHPKNKKEKIKTPSKCLWKPGMPCRAIYDYDGLEYEAVISRIINDKECVVKFLGYNNCQIVPISILQPTHGKNEQVRQVEQAFIENTDDGFASQSPNGEKMDFESDRMQSPGDINQLFHRKKKAPKKKAKKSVNGFDLPDLPQMCMLRNFGNMELPLPPPPPLSLPINDRADSEDQAMSSMLLSWYMSGYYTGLYQGMKRAKESRKST